MYQRPTGDDRRSTLNTNDLRGKMLRIKVKDGDITAAEANKADFGRAAARTRSRPGTCTRSSAAQPQAKTGPRSTRWASATRSGSRSTRTTSPTSATTRRTRTRPQRSRGPAGVGRFEIVRQAGELRLPDVLLEQARLLPVELQGVPDPADGTDDTVGTPLDTPPQPIDCGASTFINDSRWNLNGGPGNEPGLRKTPPIDGSGHLVLLQRQPRGQPARDAVLRLLRDDPRPDRAGLVHRVPAAVPGAVHGRRRSARHREVQLRPGEPEPDEVPALLRRQGHPRRVHPGHDARDEARLAEPRVRRSTRS